MPKKVLPNRDVMQLFISRMQGTYGCTIADKHEVIEWIKDIPRDEPLSRYKQSQSGIELCLKYMRPDHSVMVIAWTTYVAGNESVRNSDAAWVIIVDTATRKPLLFSFPMHRTKNFLEKLEHYLRAFIELVNTWPNPCKVCGKPITIKQVPNVLLGKTFACPNGHPLRGWIYQNLSEKNRKFLEVRYRNYDRYLKKNAESGKQVTPRVFIRSRVASPTRKGRSKQGEGNIGNVSHSDEYSQINPKTEEYPFSDTQYENE